jgi:hypothetical protein
MLRTPSRFKVNFIAKVKRMGKHRCMVIFPSERNDDGEHLKGKYVKVLLEEITL